MTREEVQPAWEIIVDKGFSNYQSLTRDERVWFNLEPLTTGGISDHYINYGAEYNKDTIKDLEYIECHEVANLLKRMNRFFLWGRPSKNIDRRNRQIMRIGDKHPDLLDEIDAKYWKLNDGLEKTLMEHINRTGIGLIK
ncbi:hypothetical protein AWE51_25425 [Aquimarina aggregata]|uniref:DNA mimic protein DMP19 C-terminal domain-containing protein n=1 Tax=Aquimarina aggregata TaxID=1642818 RepID=A0A162ZWD0_9FLAO|nr:hypothetical protein AWE51_25425 [Aquimarina aggregata]